MKHFERSNGLDTALYKNYTYLLLTQNEIVNKKDNEFNIVAISLLWHELPMLCRGKINVAGIRRR